MIDELQRMQVFYVNIGGGEPTVRRDFWELLDYATAHDVGVKFSTNGSRITPEIAGRLAASDYVDVQISLDGATAAGQRPRPRRRLLRDGDPGAWSASADAGFEGFKVSVVVTRENAGQLDAFKAIADRYGAQLRLTRLRPSGRGADVWDELHPTAAQQRQLYDWLLEHGEDVLTGDSFFHLAATATRCPGLNLCGAGRVVCLIDPVGDVYACPFAIHEEFLAGNVRDAGGFATRVARVGAVPRAARAADRRRVRRAAQLRRLPRRLHGGEVLHRPAARRPRPGVRAGPRRGAAGAARRARRPAAVAATTPAARPRRAGRACDENPLAGSRRSIRTEGDA